MLIYAVLFKKKKKKVEFNKNILLPTSLLISHLIVSIYIISCREKKTKYKNILYSHNKNTNEKIHLLVRGLAFF